MRRAVLTVGSRIVFDGEEHRVDEIRGPQVHLTSYRGITRVVSTGRVLKEAELGGGEEHADVLPGSALLESLPPGVREEALSRLAEINEVNTGYRSGHPDLAAPGEPRDEYDPTRTSPSQRVAAKAAETGWSERTINRLRALFTRDGVWGLVDHRKTGLAKAKGLSAEVLSAAEAVAEGVIEGSTLSKKEFRRRVQAELDHRHGKDVMQVPPESTFNKKLDETLAGRAIFGPAKRRRSTANRPDAPYRRFHASRAGEYVLIDSSPYDVFAVDPVTGTWVALELTIALDLYTRSILAWRFTPRSAKGVDAALLLRDIILPKALRDGWDDDSAWRYHGVPEALLLEANVIVPGERAAAIPVVRPETVVVDRGKIFLSQVFQDGCARLGISIHLSRPYRPTDKSHIERMFRTIRESLVEKLPGYKGPDVAARGQHVEDEAFLFVSELEAYFAEWVVTYWQVRHHDGLSLPNTPHIRVSPNDMYDDSVARWGLTFLSRNG